jgi:WD40 repeat protein
MQRKKRGVTCEGGVGPCLAELAAAAPPSVAMAALGPDCDLELPPEGGTPSLGPDLASSADGATIAYASRSTVVLVDAPGVGGGGRPRALKLQEDGCVQQLRWVGPVCGAERLVAAAQSSVQVWSADGSLLCLCWALPAPPPGLDGPVMACCVAAVAPAEAIYVGASSGDIFVFSGVGDSFSYKQTVRAHDRQVCALASNDAASPSVLVSGDATGEIRAWDAFSMSTTVSIRGAGFAVTSLLLGEGTIVAGYETGHVRVFDLQVRGSSRPPNCEILLTGIPLCNVSLLATKVKWRATDYRRGGGGVQTGAQLVEITAHLRRVCSVRLHPTLPLFLSAGEDNAINIWSMPDGAGRCVQRPPSPLPFTLHRWAEALPAGCGWR